VLAVPKQKQRVAGPDAANHDATHARNEDGPGRIEESRVQIIMRLAIEMGNASQGKL
jgi:hypothetical protein